MEKVQALPIEDSPVNEKFDWRKNPEEEIFPGVPAYIIGFLEQRFNHVVTPITGTDGDCNVISCLRDPEDYDLMKPVLQRKAKIISINSDRPTKGIEFECKVTASTEVQNIYGEPKDHNDPRHYLGDHKVTLYYKEHISPWWRAEKKKINKAKET